jgi:hypothetical protein
MSTEIATRDYTVPAELQEKALLGGDLSKLTIPERLSYYQAVCKSVGLNPMTRPFEYLLLGQGEDKKLVLYARKDCTDQLRDLHGISVEISSRDIVDGVCVVTAKAKNMTERMDESIGAVPVVSEDGEWKTASSGKRYFQGSGTYKPFGPLERANAIMKAETKAKRRVTLSICGLGMMDESEIEGLPEAKKAYHADDETRVVAPAEIRGQIESKPPPEPAAADELEPHLTKTDSEAVPSASQHALPPSTDDPDDPAEDYRIKLRVCERTKQAMTHTYNAIPEAIRQVCHAEYQTQLRSLDKKK